MRQEVWDSLAVWWKAWKTSENLVEKSKKHVKLVYDNQELLKSFLEPATDENATQINMQIKMIDAQIDNQKSRMKEILHSRMMLGLPMNKLDPID